MSTSFGIYFPTPTTFEAYKDGTRLYSGTHPSHSGGNIVIFAYKHSSVSAGDAPQPHIDRVEIRDAPSGTLLGSDSFTSLSGWTTGNTSDGTWSISPAGFAYTAGGLCSIYRTQPVGTLYVELQGVTFDGPPDLDTWVMVAPSVNVATALLNEVADGYRVLLRPNGSVEVPSGTIVSVSASDGSAARPTGIFRYPYEFSSLDPDDRHDFVSKIMDRDRAIEDYVSGAGIGTLAHGDIGSVTADQHHPQEHTHNSDGSGSVSHDVLTDVSANDHHNQAHAIDGADHTASGLTGGHVLRATGATTFAFGALQDSDVPSTIARDSEVTTAVSNHEAAADPHTGYLKESIIDAKGDLIAGTADNTPARLAVGADDYVLTADSAEATGMKWAAAASGSAEFVPYYLGTGETFTLPVYKQALYHEPIELDGGTLDVAGLLIEIEQPQDLSALFHMGAI